MWVPKFQVEGRGFNHVKCSGLRVVEWLKGSELRRQGSGHSACVSQISDSVFGLM